MKVSKLAKSVIVIGITCFVIGFLLLVFNVLIIKSVINKEKVLTQGADAYDAWLHIRAPLYLKVYVFNLTNADEVAAGSDRLVVKEIGPYVFQDHRDKIIYDDDGKTITYMPKSRFEFIPEMTEGNLTLSDLITTVNIPLVVASTMAKEFKDKALVANAIKAVVAKHFKLMETRTVDELVFGGYVAPIFESLRTLLPLMKAMKIHKDLPEKMAILWDKNMTEKEGNWTVGTSSSEFSRLKLWNGSPALGKWETNSTCDTARGTDGIQFPPDIKKEDRLDVFFGVYFCRSIGFTFDHDEDLLGVRVKHFSQNSFYDSKSDDDRCYCTPSMDCDQDGVFHAGPCMQGAPIFFSKPHFLEAPFYQANITGLKPDPGEHDGWLKIEPWLGQTALAGIKLQPNIALEPDHSMKIPFAPNLLPLLWIDGTNGFGQEQVDMLNSLLFNKIRILRTMASVLLVAGFVLVTAFLYYNHRRKGQLV